MKSLGNNISSDNLTAKINQFLLKSRRGSIYSKCYNKKDFLKLKTNIRNLNLEKKASQTPQNYFQKLITKDVLHKMNMFLSSFISNKRDDMVEALISIYYIKTYYDLIFCDPKTEFDENILNLSCELIYGINNDVDIDNFIKLFLKYYENYMNWIKENDIKNMDRAINDLIFINDGIIKCDNDDYKKKLLIMGEKKLIQMNETNKYLFVSSVLNNYKIFLNNNKMKDIMWKLIEINMEKKFLEINFIILKELLKITMYHVKKTNKNVQIIYSNIYNDINKVYLERQIRNDFFNEINKKFGVLLNLKNDKKINKNSKDIISFYQKYFNILTNINSINIH